MAPDEPDAAFPTRDALRLEGRAAAAQSAELGRQLFLLLERYQTAMDLSSRRVQRSAGAGAALIWSASGAAVLITLLVGIQFARAIIEPIERLTRTVRAVRLGRLGRTVDIRSRDELGSLGREFNRMTARLADFEAMNVQTLVAEKRKTESLVETMPSPVFVTDAADRLVLANHAALALLAAAEDENAVPVDAAHPALSADTALGRWRDARLDAVVPAGPLREHLAPPHPPAVSSIVDAVVDASGDGALVPTAPSPSTPDDPSAAVFALVVDGEERFFRARHRLIPGDVSAPDESGDSEVRGMLRVTLLEDVTHFKRLDQMKTDFIAAVSHELRTPLMSIGMAVDLIREGTAGAVTEMQDDLLGSVKDDHARLKRLVGGLLSLARTESGLYAPVVEPLRLADVVAEAVAPLRLPFREHAVALDVDVPVDLPRLDGDAQHLGWVVSNLVGNALKHTPEGGRVAVTARALDAAAAPRPPARTNSDSADAAPLPAGPAIHLTVRDSGEGIPGASLDAIFSAFVQIKDRNAATPGSVGLGLHLARRVVAAHSGRIWAESVVGEGSTFHVVLPLGNA